jgi:hypothetical protein
MGRPEDDCKELSRSRAIHQARKPFRLGSFLIETGKSITQAGNTPEPMLRLQRQTGRTA